MKTIAESIQQFIKLLEETRSIHTAKTYSNGISAFITTLEDQGIKVDQIPAGELPEDAVSWFAADLKSYSPSTEVLYITAVFRFYEYLAAENLAAPNLSRLRLLIRHRSRRPGVRLPQFPADKIDNIIKYAINIVINPSHDQMEQLRNFRDCAFILTLADTGLRVHEACALRRGDIDWNEGHAFVLGKGNRQSIVRFSRRSLSALKAYLENRAKLDGSSQRPLGSLPLFARHDRGAGKKVKPISTTTGRNIINQRVKEAIGEEAVGLITPHSFRHYFVTTVLRASGNLKLAQELARHTNIAVTQRYAHLSNDELDKGYYEIFDET